MSRRRAGAVVFSSLMLGACASSPGVRATDLPEQPSIATAGSRCQGEVCTCRDPQSERHTTDEGPVAEGQRRFELRVGAGLDPMSVTVDGRGTLRAPHGETPGATCAYVDLPPGKHRVRFHAVAAKPEEGMAPSLAIAEWGARTKDWYDTFDLRCGTGETCTKGDMQDWIERLRTVTPHGLFDKCGSVRVEGIEWFADHSPGTRVEDVTVQLVLHVYSFVPTLKHGDAGCPAKANKGGAPTDEQQPDAQ